MSGLISFIDRPLWIVAAEMHPMTDVLHTQTQILWPPCARQRLGLRLSSAAFFGQPNGLQILTNGHGIGTIWLNHQVGLHIVCRQSQRD